MKTINIVVLIVVMCCTSANSALAKIPVSNGGENVLTYCQIGSKNWDNEYIATVEFGSVNNTPINFTNPLGNGQTEYSDFTNFSSSYTIGNVVNLELVTRIINVIDTEYYTVWVDWDQSDSFEPNEKIQTISKTYGTFGDITDYINFSFTIPLDATPGQTRMRIAMSRGAEAASCESFLFGEAEDYSLLISDGSPSPNGYCGASGLDAEKAFIATVTYGDVNNIPVSPATPLGNGSNNYGNFSNLSDNFIKGYTFELSITALLFGIPAGTYYYTVWIDLDQDGNFEPSEKIGPIERTYAAGTNAADQIDLVPNIPLSASVGSTGMRVAMKRGAEAMACETFLYGEVEDYSIVIDDLPTPPPAPGVFTMLSEKYNGNWTELGNTFRATYIEKYAIEEGENNMLEYNIVDVSSNNHPIVKSGSIEINYGVNNISLKIDALDTQKEYRFELIGANKNIDQYLYFKKI